MIPKIIHYCWFGGNPLPESAINCIESWKKFCPDYEIVEWNEDNFDVHICPYVSEAYKQKKWAFVSDYARFWILFNYGGLYFDTDVEIINSIDAVVKKGPFMGIEPTGGVAPGLGIGAEKGMNIYSEILTYYKELHFMNEDGTLNEHTVVEYTSNILEKHGWRKEEKIVQNISDITIYPDEYFCPYNYNTGKLTITSNTVSIHHYTASWHSKLDDIVFAIERCKNGENGIEYKARRVISLPFRIINKIKKIGFANTVKTVAERIKGK